MLALASSRELRGKPAVLTEFPHAGVSSDSSAAQQLQLPGQGSRAAGISFPGISPGQRESAKVGIGVQELLRTVRTQNRINFHTLTAPAQECTDPNILFLTEVNERHLIL